MAYIKLTFSIFVLLLSFIGPYNSYLNYIPFNISHYLNVLKGESIDVTISKISDLNFNLTYALSKWRYKLESEFEQAGFR